VCIVRKDCICPLSTSPIQHKLIMSQGGVQYRGAGVYNTVEMCCTRRTMLTLSLSLNLNYAVEYRSNAAIVTSVHQYKSYNQQADFLDDTSLTFYYFYFSISCCTLHPLADVDKNYIIRCNTLLLCFTQKYEITRRQWIGTLSVF
jgi:hypothetical protein